MANDQSTAKNKTAPKSTGKRKKRIAAYYEATYPERKLRRILRATGSTRLAKEWADAYHTPSGASGNGALVKVARQLGVNL